MSADVRYWQKKASAFLIDSLIGRRCDYATNERPGIFPGMEDNEITELVMEEVIEETADCNQAWQQGHGTPVCLKSP